MIKGNSKVRVVFGKRGSGKTLLAGNLVQRLDCGRVLYYDSNGHDYSDGVVCEGVPALRQYWRRVVDGDFSIVFRSITPREDFGEVCALVMACGDMVFVVDEVDMYFDDGKPCEAFADVIRRGRHEDIELIGITQRPCAMGEIRSMAQELYLFDTHEPSDLSYYRQSFSEAIVEAIKQLKQFEYVKVILPYDESRLEICKEDNGQTRTITKPAEMDKPEEPG